MGLEINHKTLVFFEETSMQLKGLFEVLQSFLTNKGASLITFVLDKEIHDSLDKYKKNNPTNGYMFEGFLDILIGTNQLDFVDTNHYFDFDKLASKIKNEQFKSILFFTQKESVFLQIKDIKVKDTLLHVFYLEEDQAREWQLAQKVKNAFFLEVGKYSNTIQFPKIDAVFSPKYGFLSLLNDAVYEGGEGFIYKTYSNQLVKIYHKEHLSYINQKKLQKMLNVDVFNPYINWPKDIVYYDNNFAGYLMDEIHDVEQLEDIRAEGFKGYDILSRYEICYNFLKHMHYLHQKNIVVGDLKLDNILIRHPNEVFMIDCGSYQIEDYPCIVFHPEYTKNIYKEEELKKFLRFPEDEYFAINTIIFEVLVGKKPNFDRESGDISHDRKVFLYPLNVAKIDKSSPIDLQLWRLMSNKMREMFYYYFTQDKVSYLPEWINELRLIIDSQKS